MKRVMAHMNEPWSTYLEAKKTGSHHVWRSHGTCERVMAHMNESWHTYLEAKKTSSHPQLLIARTNLYTSVKRERKKERERKRKRNYCRISGVCGRIFRLFERDPFICDMTQQSTDVHHLDEPVYSARERERERESEREREREKENERRAHTAVEYLGSLAQYLCSLQHDRCIRDMTQPSGICIIWVNLCTSTGEKERARARERERGERERERERERETIAEYLGCLAEYVGALNAI